MEMFAKCASTEGGLISLLSLYYPVVKWMFVRTVFYYIMQSL